MSIAMHNVAPSRALARRSRQLLALALVIGALGAFIIALGILMIMIPFVSEGSGSFSIYNFLRNGLVAFGALLFVAALAIAIRAATWKTDNDLAQALGKYLGNQLDARYTLIRNISRRDLGYIDALLIGPPGALVFRLVPDKGVFANEEANWMYQNRKGEWTPWRISPTREVVADIQKLRDYLARVNLGDVPVYGVIVFMNEQPSVQLMAKQPVVPLTHLGTLIPNMQSDYFARERVDASRVNNTIRMLYER